MPSIINTNISSLNAQLNLGKSQAGLQTALQRLSSGLRINSAKDDAAGLAIAERMTSQINGLDQAARNANDGISLSQTAEGGLGSIGDSLQRIRELAVQSANSTNSSSDRAALNAEAQSLLAEISRVSSTTQFNGINLLDGSFASSQFQVGANANQIISVNIGNASTSALGSYGGTSSPVTSGVWTAGSTISIDGTVIGASIDQSASVKGWTADSAAAKSQAINAQASVTGVSATASTTLVAAKNPIGSQSLANGDLTINGIAVGPVGAAYGAAAQGSAAAAAINLISNTTGVTATADPSSGQLILTAADGRDIILGSNNGGAGATKVLNATGLTAGGGTQTAGNVQTFAVSSSGQAADTLTIAGVTFTFDSTTANASSTPTSATAVKVGTLGVASSASAAAALVYALGVAKSNSLTDSALGTITAAVVNTQDVSLTDTRYGSVATLSSAATGTGSISTATTSTPGTDLTDGNNQTNYGKITLTSSSSFTMADVGTSGGLLAAGLSGFSPGRTLLSTLSIITVSGSNTAISTVDAALSQIDSMRADMGALQNRFTSTVTSLQTSSLNISAARSRIQDTDYAAETAALVRGQILQQAGTAMLAQANQLPNLVLSLLK